MKQMRQRVKLDELVIAANQNVKEKEYWQDQLSGGLVKTIFPYDSNGKFHQYRMEAVTFPFPRNLYERLMVLSKKSERKLNMILAAGLAALLHKYTGSVDIVMGTPIYKQKVEGDFINTVLILRQNVEDHMTFKELLLEVRQTIFNAIEHRNYPVEILAKQLNPSFTQHDDFPLFDVAYLLENIHDKNYIDHINCNMIFSFLKINENIQGVVEYNSTRYNETTIIRIINHFTYLLEKILFNVDLKFSTVDILSEIEKQRILFEFNDTKKDIPRENCFHQLFENQVLKGPDRTAAIYGTLHITYGKLNEEANRMAHRLAEYGNKPGKITAIYMRRSIKILTAVMGIFKAGGAYLPIESDYPPERVKSILEDSGVDVVITLEDLRESLARARDVDMQTKQFFCLQGDEQEDDILHQYPVTNPGCGTTTDQLAYIIYTSGSTGKPKGVMIHQLGMLNHLSAKVHDLAIQPDDIIAQTASICFDISVWQFLSGLLKGSRVLIAPKEIVLEPLELLRTLQKNRVSILEVVPSLMNTFLQVVKNEKDKDLKHLRWMIATGEALSVQLAREWFRYFPGIKIVNAYGPTEASDDVTHYVMVESPNGNPYSIPIGKPIQNTHIYIMDKHLSLCPIGISGEICVAGLGVGKGYWQDPEKTKKSFVPNPLIEEIGDEDYGTLYKTGDIGCFREDGNIEISGRSDFQVKIRGNRIELGEIENCLLNYQGINETVVMTRDRDSGDKYLCAYLVVEQEIPESTLKEYLAAVLPDYMVPSYFVQLDRFPLTTNGKIDRKALPEPQLITGEKYISPRNQLEEKLVELWAEVLEIEKNKISIDSNFFELGGDSLTGTILVSKIHKALNVKVPFPEIFRKPQVRLLSDYIERLAEDRYISIVPLEKKEYYPLSSAQKRLFILQYMEPDNSSYNILYTIPLTAPVDKDKLTATFQELISRHESLRTSFHLIGDQPIQIIHPGDINFAIHYTYLDALSREQVNDISGIAIVQDFLRSFDLSTAPLLRVGIVRINEDMNLMMINIHHIISDAPSQDVLEQDFMKLYNGETPPPLKIQYKEYSQWQNSEKVRQSIEKQKMYWLKEFEDEIPILDLPTDYPRPSVWNSSGKNMSFEVREEDAKALNQIVLEEDTTLFVVLLAIYNIFLYKITNQDDIVVGTPVVGRMHADLEKIVGMFLNSLPLRNFPHNDQSFRGFLKEVHERFTAAFSNQEYQFEELVEDLSVTRNPSRNPIFDIMFAFNDESGAPESSELAGIITSHLQPIISRYEYEKAKFDLTLHAFAAEENLSFSFEYSTNLFGEKTIRRFVSYFKQVLADILDNPGKPIFQIEIMSEEEKKKILSGFNDTDTDYPKERTIQSFFHERVIESPENTALIFEGRELTYRGLNQRANQLAIILKQKGVGPGTIVSLTVKRSLEMVVGIFAILKAGGAYLPIDPDYPVERRKYLYRDSTAALNLTQGSLSLSWEGMGEVVDLEDESLYRGDKINLEEIAGAGDIAYVIYTSGTTGKPKGVMIEHRSVVNRINWMQREYPIAARDVILQKTPFTFDVSVWELFWWSFQGASLRLLGPGEEKDPEAIVKAIAGSHVTVIHFVPSMLNTFLEYVGDSETRYLKALSSLEQTFCSGEALTVHQVEKFNTLLYQANNTKLANLYGPTEATVDVSYFNCPPGERLTKVPIGKPIDNIRLYVVDSKMTLLPIGVTGELCISGDGVARGYLNRPELTAERFVEHMSYRSYRSPIYRTGDLTRWLPDENIEYLGRIDHQVKIRGLRIEPGEIERQLVNHEQVKKAVVITKKETNHEKYLCAYIVPEGELNVLQVREFLSGVLPDYMIPAYFYQVEEIPLTTNGKVDRKKLTSSQSNLDPGIEYIAPSTDMERKITDIWKDILKLDKVGVMDNFFLVGGNSLKVILLYRRLREELNLDISVASLFERVTVGSFVQYLQDREKEESIIASKEIERVDEISKARNRKRKQIARRRIGVVNE